MKRLCFFLLLLLTLSQCKKSDTTEATNTIFDFPVNTSLMPDTVKDLDNGGTGDGFIFSYDNLNRVTAVNYYEYFLDQALYNDRTSTFHYSGNDMLPASVDLVWTSSSASVNGKYKIYFFYNADKSKNRDSVIDLNDNTQNAVRKYTYDWALNYAKTDYYKTGSTQISFTDSASFVNYNCVYYRSDRIKYSFGNPYIAESAIAQYVHDNRTNPLSGLNIFPALFMNNCLFWGYHTDDIVASPTVTLNFVSQNNVRRSNCSHYGSGGPASWNPRYSRTAYDDTYDASNRLLKRKFQDSVLTPTYYPERYSLIYRYHN